MTRAALYPRVSSKKQEDGTSLDSQERMAREFCAQHGYIVDEAHVYREVFTGEELWTRPQLTRLREAARAHAFDVVVLHATDRFSRKQAHTFILADELERLGIRLEFVTETFEDTAVGRFMHSAKAFAAEVELEKLRERTARGRRDRVVEQGKLLPGPRPLYGYQWVDLQVAEDADDATRRRNRRVAYATHPTTSGVVQQIFTWAAKGETMRAIAARLTTEGIPTPSGRGTSWRLPTLQWILHHPAYTGAAVANRHVKVKDRQRGTKRVLLRPADEHLALPEGTVPALVDRATWAAVQQRLAHNKSFAVRNAKHPEDALLRAGYVRCGECGRSMWVQSPTKHRGGVYRCAKSSQPIPGECALPTISTRALDAAVWAKVTGLLNHPEHVAAELERMRREDPSTADLEAVERALTKAVCEQRNLIENLAKVSGAAADMVAGKINVLEQQRADLSHERDGILARSATWQRAQERIGDVQAWCRAYAESIGTLTYDEKRLALDGLGVTVKVWRADHEPRYQITASIPLDRGAVNETSWGSIHNHGITFIWTDRDALTPAAPVMTTA